MLETKVGEMFAPLCVVNQVRVVKERPLRDEIMSAFDRAWEILKEGEPFIEFGGNDICPECGSKMKQTTAQLGFGYPVVHGWDCPKCESFTPHDQEYSKTEQTKDICAKCMGSGDAKNGLKCDMCNGTGWG